MTCEMSRCGAVPPSPEPGPSSTRTTLLTVLAFIGGVRNFLASAGWSTSMPAGDGMPPLSREDKLELLRLIARRMQDGPAGLAGNHLPGADLQAQFEG